MSAFVVVKQFATYIKNRKANVELVVRMIIGCEYVEEQREKSYENAMINLIHGDVIDADGLDYVCRDSWASGYSTGQVDIDRLISSLLIEKDEMGLYRVCYTPKAINEIDSVLAIKNFQQTNVITHHTVVYERYLLLKAMESTALYYFSKRETKDEREREVALARLCDFHSLVEEIVLPKFNTSLIYPMDDDFIALMKSVLNENSCNKYIKQWFGRDYLLKPLWKSKADFYAHFDCLIGKKFTETCWLFSEECRKFIASENNIPVEDIWILQATDKYKGDFAGKVNLYVEGKILPYKELFPNDKYSYYPDLQPFFYIFVPKEVDRMEIIKHLKEKVKSYIFS